MTYSCSDFMDDVLRALKVEAPADAPEDFVQGLAQLAVNEIQRLQVWEKPLCNLTESELCLALEEMRRRGWAVAAYGVNDLAEGPCQDENGDADDERVAKYLEENREALEELMCEAVWQHVSADYKA